MANSLKRRNNLSLAAVVCLNLVGYLTALRGGLVDTSWFALLTAPVASAPLLVVASLTAVLNSQIGHMNKARLVFWRWSHPLPGSRAFSEIMHTDPRIDVPGLLDYVGNVPTEPREQNALWYRWYRDFHSDPGVMGVHKDYLLCRDWAGIAAILGAMLIPLAVCHLGLVLEAVIFVAAMVAQYILVRRAARDRGIRLVASVLACKASTVLSGKTDTGVV